MQKRGNSSANIRLATKNFMVPSRASSSEQNQNQDQNQNPNKHLPIMLTGEACSQ
jgi:hypothetical protein